MDIGTSDVKNKIADCLPNTRGKTGRTSASVEQKTVYGHNTCDDVYKQREKGTSCADVLDSVRIKKKT